MAELGQPVTELGERELEQSWGEDLPRAKLRRKALARLQRLVRDNRDVMGQVREAGLDNESFWSPLGDQWPNDIAKIYRALKIPAKGINKVWTVVAAVTGVESTQRFKAKFQGEDPDDQGLADAFNAATQRELRRGGFEACTSAVFRQAAVQRLGMARVTTDLWGSRKASFHMRRLRLEEGMVDWYAQETNLRDRDAMAHGSWMSLEEFVEFYPEPEAEEIFQEASAGEGAGTIADFDNAASATDIWNTTVGLHHDSGFGSGMVPYRRATKEIFVVHLEWRERTQRFEVELPGETAQVWQQQFEQPLIEDEDLDELAAAAAAVGMAAAQAAAIVEQQIQQFRQAIEQYQQQAAQMQQMPMQPGQPMPQMPPKPEPPEILPVVTRKLTRQALGAFQEGYSQVAGRPLSRVWELKVPTYYQATILGDRVPRVSKRPDNYWSLFALIPFQVDTPQGVRSYSLVDILRPRQVWLNMFISVWMHQLATMPKAQFGVDTSRGDDQVVTRINSEIAKGGRAIGFPGGKDSIFQLPGGTMPEGVEEAMQLFISLVPDAAGQQGNLPISGDLRRTASALVTHQLELSNKVLAEMFGALKEFRREIALKIAHSICAYWSPEEFRKAAGRFGKSIPDDRSLWWKFLEFDLVVSEEPATRDTAQAVVEALNQTAMWQAIWAVNPQGLMEVLTPLVGSTMAETTIARLRESEPQQLVQRLAELTGADPNAIQAALQSAAPQQPTQGAQ